MKKKYIGSRQMTVTTGASAQTADLQTVFSSFLVNVAIQISYTMFNTKCE